MPIYLQSSNIQIYKNYVSFYKFIIISNHYKYMLLLAKQTPMNDFILNNDRFSI